MTAAALDRASDAPLGSRLTGREFQVLCLIALGRSNIEIGAELFLTPNTVHSHLRRIFARLGARTRANAVAIAYHRRILLPPGEARRAPLPDFTRAGAPVSASVVAQALLVREWARSGRSRVVRVALGLSAAQVGASCGVSATAVAHWEAGRSVPRGEFLEAYFRALREMSAAADAEAQNGPQGDGGDLAAAFTADGLLGAQRGAGDAHEALQVHPRDAHSAPGTSAALSTASETPNKSQGATGPSAARPAATEAHTETLES